MRKMKDSGVEWIGQIPEEWEVGKIGQVYEERNIKVSDKNYVPLSVTKQGIVPQLETAAKTDNGDNRKQIQINDFVINSRSDRRGSCGISKYNGSCSLINTVLKPRKNMCNQYFSLVFKSDLFADEFYKWGNGIVDDLWSTKWSNMKRIYIPSPPLPEQHRIADFLDRKCGKIDDTIEKEKQVIEKLKEYKQSVITEAVTKGLDKNAPMKDSGIEWIGDIPHVWEVCKIKNLCSMQSGANLTSEQIKENGEFAVYGGNGLRGYYTNYNNDGEYILIGRQGALAGNVHIVKGAFWATDHCVVVYNTCNISKYLYYLFISMNFNQYAYDTSAQPGLSVNRIINLTAFIPPLPEQQAIADYLDKKCSAVDKTIEDRQKLIEKLTEYKKSLIYEAVTGKIEV